VRMDVQCFAWHIVDPVIRRCLNDSIHSTNNVSWFVFYNLKRAELSMNDRGRDIADCIIDVVLFWLCGQPIHDGERKRQRRLSHRSRLGRMAYGNEGARRTQEKNSCYSTDLPEENKRFPLGRH